jgi:outer membrane protein assembly factor BamB
VSHYRALAIAMMLLLVVSGLLGIFVTPSLAPTSAAPAAGVAGANWADINYNLNGTNYSPQTALTPSNAGSLVMNWTVPMPSTDPSWAQVGGGVSWQVEPGADSPPLLVNGIAYFVTNQGVVYALNAENGVQVWSKAITADFKAALTSVPLIESQVSSGKLTPCSSTACTYNDTFWCSASNNAVANCASPVEHKHGINFFSTSVNGTVEQIISVTGFDCEVWGFNAITGDVAYHIQNICVNVIGDGNGAYPATYTSDPPEYYNPTNSSSSAELLYVQGGYTDMGGRTFLAAFNLTAAIDQCKAVGETQCAANDGFNGEMQGAPAGQGQLWQIFLQPPSTGDSQWDYENCSVGAVFDYPAYIKNGTMDVPCSAIPASVKSIGANSTYAGGDWGVPMAAAAGVSTSWGQYAIDNKTGVMYFGTGEAGPFEYCYGPTCPSTPNERPGLNLYSSSEIAVNLKTGKMIWWFQMLPHGLDDWDASWNSIIGTTNSSMSIFKATKDGILFSLNATTGLPNWVFVNPAIKFAPGLTPLDPTNATQMLTPWPNYPNATWIQEPGLAGSLEEDLAYDGNSIYGAWFNSAPNVYSMDNTTQYANSIKTLNWPDNVTVTAVNANTGKAEWSDFFNGFVFRGGMTVTNGMLIMPTGNGTLFFLNTANGKVINKLYIGSPLFVDPTIGQAANGEFVLLQIIGGGRWLAAGDVGGSLTQPGAIMAFTLGRPGAGNGTATTSTVAVVVSSDLPLNYIAYGAVTFAIVVTIANILIRRRPPKR